MSVQRMQCQKAASSGSVFFYLVDKTIFVCVLILSQLDRGLSHVTARRIPVLEANNLDCINHSH